MYVCHTEIKKDAEKSYDQRATTVINLSGSLTMEVYNVEELCFPQLYNTSCRKPKMSRNPLVFLLFFISVLTATLNLLVIISVSHFRQRKANFIENLHRQMIAFETFSLSYKTVKLLSCSNYACSFKNTLPVFSC